MSRQPVHSWYLYYTIRSPVKRTIDNVDVEDPFYFEKFIGDIGQFIEIDGVGYVIVDFVVEEFKDCGYEDLYNDSIWY